MKRAVFVACTILTTSTTANAEYFGSTTHVAAALLMDWRVELWTVNDQGRMFTTWETSIGADAGWAPATDFLLPAGGLPGPLPASAVDVAVAPVSDGTLEVWAATANGGLWTTWQTSAHANSDWEAWTNFLDSAHGSPGALPSAPVNIAVAPLSDGRLLLFVVTSNGQLFVTWKIDTFASADWAPWTNFASIGSGLPGVLPSIVRVAVAPLSDDTLQVWATTSNGGLFSTRQAIDHPDSDWLSWTNVLSPGGGRPGPLPAGAGDVAAAQLSDRRLELWTIAGGQLLTSWKANDDANADWVPWSSFSAFGSGLPGALSSSVVDVAVASYFDGRLNVWATVADGRIFSTEKLTTHPDSDWSPWVVFLEAPDTFLLRGVDASRAGIMADGADINGRVTYRSGEQLTSNAALFSVGAMMSSPVGDRVIGFGLESGAPTILPANWTPGSDQLEGTMGPSFTFPLTVWIIHGPFGPQAARALETVIAANALYSKEGVGIAFSPVEIRDVTMHPRAADFLHINANSPGLWGIGYTDWRVNLYWVETVYGAQGAGVQYDGTPRAVVGSHADGGLVAHELGHALVLEHVDGPEYAGQNIMQGTYGARLFLTEGQTYRMHFHPSSMANAAYKAHPNATLRVCSRDTTDEECPRYNKRLFADGSLPPN